MSTEESVEEEKSDIEQIVEAVMPAVTLASKKSNGRLTLTLVVWILLGGAGTSGGMALLNDRFGFEKKIEVTAPQLADAVADELFPVKQLVATVQAEVWDHAGLVGHPGSVELIEEAIEQQDDLGAQLDNVEAQVSDIDRETETISKSMDEVSRRLMETAEALNTLSGRMEMFVEMEMERNRRGFQP